MFVILTYDIRAERVNKVRKVVKQYLRPVQKSVFEGFLSEGKLKRLKTELQERVNTEEDCVRVYTFLNLQGAVVDELGKLPEADFTIL